MNINDSNSQFNHIFDNLTINYLTGGYTKCFDSWRFENIKPNFDKFYYIVDGEFYLNIDGREYTAHKNQLFLLPSNSKQSYYHISNNFVTKYWIHCNIFQKGENFLNKISLVDFVEIDSMKEMDAQFRQILLCADNMTALGRIYMQSYLLKLFATYIEKAQLYNNIELEDKKISHIVTTLKNNYNKNISIKELSGTFGYSTSYFVSHFKKSTGLAPLEYINNLRIEKAMSLLQNPDSLISEISFQVGFEDQNYFSRIFKKRTGFTPSEYRIFSASKPDEHFSHNNKIIGIENQNLR